MTERSRSFCTKCGGQYALTTQGRIWAHGDMRRLCTGSGRRPWCGRCNRNTRRIEVDDHTARCIRCHPKSMVRAS